ncbi:MAG TPA: hypothetical protein ENG63_08830 [Candidatus Desulfofervidus auxilii]|uniref:Lipoprotein n=1 Tax=Desulfofervidus auxilii TaxID=1621989 RepID=A0A7C0Y3R8_DESA2|nr:hypothetical protein [Candidatus Desulfofervidus auxilii]
MRKKVLGLLVLVFFPLLLAACGGESSSGGSSSSSTTGTVSALKVAEKVSVVDAKESTSSGIVSKIKPLKIGITKLSPSDLPSNSDYFKDETFVYVEERSIDAFNIVNEILCALAQTKYDEMLNKGTYKAQIDINQCSTNNDDVSNAGQQSLNQTSGSTMPDYEMWIVNSSRADNNSPQIVKAWIHEESDGAEPEKMIFVKMTITEGVSATNPYGIFTLNFKAHPVVNGEVDTSTELFKGYLKSEKDESNGKILLKFICNGNFDTPEGTIEFDKRVTLDRAIDGSSGAGTIYSKDTFPGPNGSQTEEIQFNIAFNTQYFRRVSANDDVCLSRTSFDETAWRYGLYDSNGNRVNRNSGFPIKITQNGKDYYGWIGYWGLWFPEDVTVNNGDTVYKLSYGPGGGTETPYTVFISNGRLIKHTKKTLKLGDIKNVPLQYHEFDPNIGTDSEYRVEWNGTNFVKVARLNKNTWMWENISPPQPLTFGEDDYSFDFWSDALGGSGHIDLRDPNTGQLITLNNNVEVIFHIEDLVYPSDTVPSTLVCFEDCPDPTKITTNDPYYDTSNYQYQNVPPANAQKISYSFDLNKMVLQKDGQDIVLTTTNNTYPWGIRSGPLFEPTAENLNKLACDWDPNSTCAWQAWNKLDVFYTWETGPNEWNKFTALKDSNNDFLTFDPPLPVEYVHTWNDGTTTKFYLEYSGFGELHGIPGKCIDIDTGEEESCDETSRWVPEFSIPNGSEVTDATNGTKYLVKALEKEQRMKVVNSSYCSSLTVTTYDLPTIDEWIDPDIGPAPEVSGPPAVIGGVVQQ